MLRLLSLRNAARKPELKSLRLALVRRGSEGTGQQKPSTYLAGRCQVRAARICPDPLSRPLMSNGRMIDYESLAQDAMRGVVRTVLARTAKNGLPGDHHFYISFDTQAPGVGLSKRLKEKYPEEMTIVLQHRFWDLSVTEDRFEVKLTFDGIPERLVIPFAALKVFFDPSVRYGLQFESPDLDAETIVPPQETQEEAAPAGFAACRIPRLAAAGRRAQTCARSAQAARGPVRGAGGGCRGWKLAHRTSQTATAARVEARGAGCRAGSGIGARAGGAERRDRAARRFPQEISYLPPSSMAACAPWRSCGLAFTREPAPPMAAGLPNRFKNAAIYGGIRAP